MQEKDVQIFNKIKLSRKEEEREFLIGIPSSAEEIKEAITILTKLILDSEPMAIYTNLTFEERFKFLFSDIITKSLPINAFSIAKDLMTNKIIGVCYGIDDTHMFTEGALQEYDKHFHLGVCLWRKYVKTFEEKYHEDTKICRIQYVCVDREYYGFGLGKMLVSQIIAAARGHGFQLMAYEASNIFSLSLAKQIGFIQQCSYIFDECGEETPEGVTYRYKGINEWYEQFIQEKTGKSIKSPALEFVFLTQEL